MNEKRQKLYADNLADPENVVKLEKALAELTEEKLKEILVQAQLPIPATREEMEFNLLELHYTNLHRMMVALERSLSSCSNMQASFKAIAMKDLPKLKEINEREDKAQIAFKEHLAKIRGKHG